MNELNRVKHDCYAHSSLAVQSCLYYFPGFLRDLYLLSYRRKAAEMKTYTSECKLSSFKAFTWSRRFVSTNNSLRECNARVSRSRTTSRVSLESR